MFDIQLGSQISTTVNFNSVSGTLIKSAKESKIVRFHFESKMAETFFDEDNPHRTDKNGYLKKKIVVLQVMICSKDNFLVEYLDIE